MAAATPGPPVKDAENSPSGQSSSRSFRPSSSPKSHNRGPHNPHRYLLTGTMRVNSSILDELVNWAEHMTEPLDPFDVTALEKSVNDSAVRVSTIWVSFLVFGLYLAVAAANVSHHQLLIEEAIKLPTINAEMPLVAFFLLAPLVFAVFHVYVLLQVALLARTAVAYNDAVVQSVHADTDRALIRQRLANTLFAQILAGSPFEREGVLGVLLRTMSWATLVILPVAVLLVFQFKFLPYHSASITSLHRILVALSLSTIVLIWPIVLEGGRNVSLRHAFDHPLLLLWACLFAALSFVLLSFPGDVGTNVLRIARGETNGAGYCDQTLLERFLGNGANRLIVRWENVVDKKKLDAITAEQGPYEGEPTKSFRHRDLSCAVLSDGDFRYSDFRGAVLNGINFQSAKLDGAWFDEAQLAEANLRDANLKGAYLRSARLQGGDLSAARFERANLDGADLRDIFTENLPFRLAKSEAPLNQTARVTFTEASLIGAQLENANLANADLSWARLDKTMLRRARLEDANLSNASLQGANLEGALLEHANVERALLNRARLRNAILRNAQLRGAHLEDADLERAVLDQADLTEVALTGASLREASLRKAQLSRLQLQAIDFEKADLAGADLEHASLVEARLPGASLSRANLTDADLSRANLKAVLLDEAALERANFSDAEVWAAKFDGAKLEFAVFDRAQLQAASFSGTKLHRASFAGAQLEAALFARAGLDGAIFHGSRLRLATISSVSMWAARGAQCKEAQVLEPRFEPTPEYPSDGTLSETEIAEAEENWRNCAAQRLPAEMHDEALADFFFEFACRPGNHQVYVAKALIVRLDQDPYRTNEYMRKLFKRLLEADYQTCPGIKDLPESTKCRLSELAGPAARATACKTDPR